ncbi:MAG: hypothetical protein JWQ25_1364, partial [Daejeonella sp.]|nr:hypothetical protein [Daejeonella sp.]
MNDRFVNGIGIYFLDKDTLSKVLLDKIAKDKFTDFRQFDRVPESLNLDVYSISIQKPSKEFAPPDSTSIGYFARGLSEKEKSNLQKYTNVVSIVFQGKSKDVYNKQKRINDFVNELVKNRNVVIADFNSYEWFNSKSWNENRVNNFTDSIRNIVNQISIHSYRDGEFCRAITMGMDKFSLPDISIKAFACSDQNTYSSLINAAIQTLAENPYMLADSTLSIDLKSIKNDTVRNRLRSNLGQNAKENAVIKYKSVKPEEGDNFNQQFLISFQDGNYNNPQEEQDKLVADLFGSEDSIVRVTHDSLLSKT